MMKPLQLGRIGCLKGAAKSPNEDDFFGLKQEYDQYHEQLRTIEGYEKRLAEHKEGLRVIEDQAMTLWYNLGVEAPVSPTELKRIYNQYKNFQQNKIVWEQKEAQRKASAMNTIIGTAKKRIATSSTRAIAQGWYGKL